MTSWSASSSMATPLWTPTALTQRWGRLPRFPSYDTAALLKCTHLLAANLTLQGCVEALTPSSHAMQTDSREGDSGMWMQMAERSSTPGGPWRMGGLGFGLPLSRLYARYFGAFGPSDECPARRRQAGSCCCPNAAAALHSVVEDVFCPILGQWTAHE